MSTKTEPTPTRPEALIGAGFVASRDFGNQMGLSLVAFEQLGRIYRQQFEWFVEDQQASFQMLGATLNPLSVLMDHVGRRSQHISEGIQQFMEAAQEISDRSVTLREDVWDPLANVVDFPAAPFPRAFSRRSIMERLRTDHQRLAQILAKMEQLIEQPLQPKVRDLLVTSVEYISEYPDTVHHPLEDKLFAHLLTAELSEEERRDVEANAASHTELVAASQAVLREVNALQPGQDTATGALKTAIGNYIDLQRRHMAFEESHVFRLADRKLPASALHELTQEDERSHDPLFDEHREHYENLYLYVSGRL